MKAEPEDQWTRFDMWADRAHDAIVNGDTDAAEVYAFIAVAAVPPREALPLTELDTVPAKKTRKSATKGTP